MLRNMDDQQRDDDAQKRVEALEQEVAQLRSQLQAHHEDPLDVVEEEPLSAEEIRQFEPARSRVILVAVLAGLVALGAMLAITLTLGSWFDSAAKEAAKTLVPEDVDEDEDEDEFEFRKKVQHRKIPEPGKSAPLPPAKTEDPSLPRAPGL